MCIEQKQPRLPKNVQSSNRLKVDLDASLVRACPPQILNPGHNIIQAPTKFVIDPYLDDSDGSRSNLPNLNLHSSQTTHSAEVWISPTSDHDADPSPRRNAEGTSQVIQIVNSSHKGSSLIIHNDWPSLPLRITCTQSSYSHTFAIELYIPRKFNGRLKVSTESGSIRLSKRLRNLSRYIGDVKENQREVWIGDQAGKDEATVDTTWSDINVYFDDEVLVNVVPKVVEKWMSMIRKRVS